VLFTLHNVYELFPSKKEQVIFMVTVRNSGPRINYIVVLLWKTAHWKCLISIVHHLWNRSCNYGWPHRI